MKSYTNIQKCFDDNFTSLFDKECLVYTNNIPSMASLNNLHGKRTLHRLFDNINDYHSATIAHHDMSNEEHIEHFKRGLLRLDYIKHNHIPILFVNISHSSEFNNSFPNPKLIQSIRQNGFSNMKLLSIYLDNTAIGTTMKYMDDYHIIYITHSDGYNSISDDTRIRDIIMRHFVPKLISKEGIDNA